MEKTNRKLYSNLFHAPVTGISAITNWSNTREKCCTSALVVEIAHDPTILT